MYQGYFNDWWYFNDHSDWWLFFFKIIKNSNMLVSSVPGCFLMHGQIILSLFDAWSFCMYVAGSLQLHHSVILASLCLMNEWVIPCLFAYLMLLYWMLLIRYVASLRHVASLIVIASLLIRNIFNMSCYVIVNT